MIKFLKYKFIVVTTICTAIVMVVMFIVLPQTAPYKNLLKILSEEQILTDSIGDFKRIDRFPDHDIHYNDTSGYGIYWIWVYGSKGRADVYIKIINDKGIWKKDSFVIHKIEWY